VTLLNYTTTVPTTRTVGQVQALLAAAGAGRVLTEYGTDRRPTGVAFTITTAHGPRDFALPVDAARVERVLTRQRVAPRYRGRDHAERVAWRIVKDWLEAQLAIIATEMVTLGQVMLPYMTEGGRTVYDLYVGQQLALTSGATP
jgi:hypothetical protein